MKIKFILLAVSFASFVQQAISQNVGINSTGAAPNASAMLDIVSTSSGLLVPRMTSAQKIAIASPATGLLVYQTDAGTQGIGFYFYNGIAWVPFSTNNGGWGLSGNIGTTASSAAYGSAITNNWIGTGDNIAMVFGTNNLERMRINPTDGEICIGAKTSGLAGDLLCAVSNATTAWAVNGYSGQNGGGTYGQITGGTTQFAAVQGEYYGTATGGAGVRGSYAYATTASGTSFNLGAERNGIEGYSTVAGSYKFGVAGTGGISLRSGGVIGNDGNVRWGGLGYFSNAGTDYSIYGFGTAVATGVLAGRLSSTSQIASVVPNNQVGLGIYGGVMGGWIKGLVYGTNLSGQKYGVYVHGNTVTNSKYVQLNNSTSSDARIASYATTALTNELTSKGKINLINGQATVAFDTKIIELCDLSSLVITATPMGNCNGVFIDNLTENGFMVKEINNGTHNVSVSFIISGTLKQATEFTEADILNKQYETNMNGVMHNDYDTSVDGTPIWYDGATVRHDAVDENINKVTKENMAKDAEKMARPMTEVKLN